MISKINLIGAFSNTWGVEHHIFDALKELGYKVERFDHRRGECPYAIHTIADMTLVLRGDNISPLLINKFPRPTVLWYGEIIPQSLEKTNVVSMGRLQELAQNVSSFDLVFHNDYTSLDVVRGLGARKVFWLHTSGVNPQVHKKLELPKVYDVGFAGGLSQRRRDILDSLKRSGINVAFKEVYGKELNYFINQCKIFLNIHYCETPVTETRLNETLGAGTFCLSEEVSMPDMYIDGEHLVYWKFGDLEDLKRKIEYYLNHEDQREMIALKGFQMVHSRYRFTDRCKELLKVVHYHLDEINLSKYEDSLGILFDKDGNKTFNIDKFYEAVQESLKKRQKIL